MLYGTHFPFVLQCLYVIHECNYDELVTSSNEWMCETNNAFTSLWLDIFFLLTMYTLGTKFITFYDMKLFYDMIFPCLLFSVYMLNYYIIMLSECRTTLAAHSITNCRRPRELLLHIVLLLLYIFA